MIDALFALVRSNPLFGLVIIISVANVFLIAIFMFREARYNRIKRELFQLNEAKTSKRICLVCGNNDHTWGNIEVYMDFFSFKPKKAKPTPIVGLRCDKCGHVMFFTRAVKPKRVREDNRVGGS